MKTSSRNKFTIQSQLKMVGRKLREPFGYAKTRVPPHFLVQLKASLTEMALASLMEWVVTIIS